MDESNYCVFLMFPPALCCVGGAGKEGLKSLVPTSHGPSRERPQVTWIEQLLQSVLRRPKERRMESVVTITSVERNVVGGGESQSQTASVKLLQQQVFRGGAPKFATSLIPLCDVF